MKNEWTKEFNTNCKKVDELHHKNKEEYGEHLNYFKQ